MKYQRERERERVREREIRREKQKEMTRRLGEIDKIGEREREIDR